MPCWRRFPIAWRGGARRAVGAASWSAAAACVSRRRAAYAMRELFLCIDVDAGQKETLVRQASAIERDWLPAEQMSTAVEVAFDAETERVTAKRRVRFADLVIEETDAASARRRAKPPVSSPLQRPSICSASCRRSDSPAGLYRTRVRCLREWMPELQLPALDDAELREVLTWLCHRLPFVRRPAQSRLAASVPGSLEPYQRQAVEREAPERLVVPSGSRIALRYELGRPPVLAVRIQEVFGWTETPRIAGGRVPVLLHLLAPNYRPQQVTDDLASFWTNTYPQVRKELRGTLSQTRLAGRSVDRDSREPSTPQVRVFERLDVLLLLRILRE